VRAGIDTGGTYTDVVTETGDIVKVPSTPSDPARAVAAGLPSGATVLAHGTTVATNALLERRGARVALVTNEGLEDVIEVARQDRPSLYDQWADRPPPLVPRHWRIGAPGRLDGRGRELARIRPDAVLLRLAELDGVEAVAVCLLHADLEQAHEQLVLEALVAAGFDAVASHQVSPEMREYERTVTTVIDAYLRPVCRAYVRRVDELCPEVQVMASSGGLLPAAVAAEHPAALLLSGPAAGVRAAAGVAAANGFAGAVSFDMGGTSTDVCLVVDAVPEPAPTLEVAGFTVRLPALDIHTIGAGGGSVAWIDAGGALQVGPRSAGAAPGPACYGLGGTEPTVTDADLLLGRLPRDHPFPGIGLLDGAAAEGALARAGVDAAGGVAVAEAAMAAAVRRVTVERGVDPAGLALVAFGGAGPVHACAIADALGMPQVIVPARAGVFSAVGLLGAPEQRDLVRSWPEPRDHRGLDAARSALASAAESLVGAGASVTTMLDCRYAGQSHELRVVAVDAFHQEHERRNGYARPSELVEVVALRAVARRPSPVDVTALPAVQRRATPGPAVIAEPDCTIFVPTGWRADLGACGALVLQRTP